MAGDQDEVLGKLSEELFAALEAGEDIDAKAWAERFGVDEATVKQCARGLAALGMSIGEEQADGHPELPQPQLPDDFELVGELGRGGMGVVYRARQRSLDRDVAIKVLRPGDLVFGEALRRFKREARSLARLRHRHIVSVYESGETPEGLVWFAMDLVDGRTLADELKRNGRMLPARATKIARQITSAIAHAHSQGIVHRDLKPHNVLIDGSGDAFVVDVGLARDASAAQTHTMSGELLGTPAYMSPEQARGDSQSIGEATDVWALGTVLYEMLTGKAPYAGKPLHETIRAILHDDAPSLRRVDKRIPQELDLICSHALQKRPQDRYRGALAFGEDIERFQDGRGVMVEKPSKLRRIGRVLKRRWRIVSAVAAAVLVTLAAVALWLPTLRRDAIVAEAQRLVASGHAGAAVESLQAILADTPETAAARQELEYHYVQALTDRAGELLLANDVLGAKERAQTALAIARRRAPGRRYVLPEDWQRQEEWRWQLARASSLADRGRAPTVPIELLRLDLVSELPGRAAIARCAATMFGVDLTRLATALQVEVIRAGCRLQAQLQDHHRQLVPASIEWVAQLPDCWSPQLEDMLADLAKAKNEAPTARALAYYLWARSVGLPTFDVLRPAGSTIKNRPSAAEIAAAVDAPIDDWREWRSLPREEALKRRIDLLAAELRNRGTVLPGAEQIWNACTQWTGVKADPPAFEAWWQEARKGDYETLLRQHVALAPDEDLSIVTALDRSASMSKGDRRHVCLWRQLAWLRVPEGKRIPEAHPFATSQSNRWRIECLEKSGHTDDRPFTASLTLLRFDDGAATPELLDQKHRTVRIGEKIEMSLRATASAPAWLSLRAHWDDEFERVPERHETDGVFATAARPALGDVTALVGAELRLTPHGVQLLPQPGRMLRQNLPWGARRNSGECLKRVWPETAHALQTITVTWDMERRVTHFVLLCSLREGSQEALDLNGWHAAIARSFSVSDTPVATRKQRAYSADWLTASLWPTPAALADMQILLDAHETTQPGEMLAALCLAGSDAVRPDWPDRWSSSRTDFGVRIATASASDSQRQRAIEALAKTDDQHWTPRIGERLTAAARAQSIALPAELTEELQALPTSDSLTDWLTRGRIVGLYVYLALFLLVAWGWFERRQDRGRRPELWFALTAYLLMFVRIQFGGVIVTPSFLVIFAMTVFLARAGTRRSWWRMCGLGLMSLLALWAAASWFLRIHPPYALEIPFLIAALLATWDPRRFRGNQATRTEVTGAPRSSADGTLRRMSERRNIRVLSVIAIVVAAGYFLLQVVSGYMSHDLLSKARVQLVDPSGNPVAGVRCLLTWARPSPYWTGATLPASDEQGIVDLSGVVDRVATLGKFDIHARLPGYQDTPRPLALSTTIELPDVGSLVVRLVDADGNAWRDSSHEEMYATLPNTNQRPFDEDGQVAFPIVACGPLRLSGDVQATDILKPRTIDGPTKSGETKVIDVVVPRNTPRLEGMVRTPDGKPASGKVHVYISSPMSQLWANVILDSQGRFRFLIDSVPADANIRLHQPFGGERTLKLPPANGPVIDLGAIDLHDR